MTDNDNLSGIYQAAGLTTSEIASIPFYIQNSYEFYDSTLYEKLYEYFVFEVSEMPYGIAKARTGDPDTWILEKLDSLM
jgi:hypothetical protein